MLASEARAAISVRRKEYIICPDAARNRMTNSWKWDWFWWINALQHLGEEGEALGILQARRQDHTLIWETKTTFFCIRKQSQSFFFFFGQKVASLFEQNQRFLSVHSERPRRCKFNSHGQPHAKQLGDLIFKNFFSDWFGICPYWHQKQF